MEAAEPASAPATGPRWPAILVVIVFALAAVFFIAVAVSLAGDELCEDVVVGECVDKSSANRAATVVASALAGLAAVWTVIASFGLLRGRRRWPAVGIAAAVTVVLAAVTIAL